MGSECGLGSCGQHPRDWRLPSADDLRDRPHRPAHDLTASRAARGRDPHRHLLPARLAHGGASPRRIGRLDQGELVYLTYCRQCHGAEGKKGIPNPYSVDGEVPQLNPIDPAISGADSKGTIRDPQKFVDGIDQYLQNGSTPDATPDGANPRYKMPSFGNTFALSQPQIADVQAYILQLNGVDRAAIVRPGVAPRVYAWWTLGGFLLVVVVGVAALVARRRT